MHHRTWLTESRNLHSNVSTSQIRTVTLQQEHAVRVFLTDEYDVDNISNNITLPSTFTSKQGNQRIPLPNSMLFSGSRTVSWQASPSKSTLHKGEGGGRNNCGRIKKRETVSEWFLHLFSVVIV